MPDRDFADRLAQAMNKAGFNQARLAKALGVSAPTVSRWLEGAMPHRLVAIRLCSALGVQHEWLMFGIEPKKDLPFTDAMRERLKMARQKEGVSLAEMAKQTGYPENNFKVIEDGSGTANWTTIAIMMSFLNVSEPWLMDGKGGMFTKEVRFVLIPPGELDQCKKRAMALREQAQFLIKQAERLEWEVEESQKQVKAAGEYYPRLTHGVRKRSRKK